VEGRLGLASFYAPYRAWGGRGGAPNPVREPDRAAAAREILRAGQRRQSALAERTLAALLLGWGDPRSVASAVAVLGRLSERRPGDAGLLSDLAAARLERARQTSDPLELILAKVTVERALKLDPANAPARFNRALLCEHLALRTEARQAWMDYLQLDTASPWAAEALQHRRALDAPGLTALWRRASGILTAASEREDSSSEGEITAIAKRFPQQTSEYVAEVLLGRWGEAWCGGREGEAGRALAAARRIGAALAETKGERMAKDEVANIADSGQRARLRSLACAHLLYREARQLYRDGDPRAWKLFARSRSLFHGSGSAYELWPALHLAINAFQGGQLSAAQNRLESILGDPRASGSPSLRVRVLWMLGLVRLARGSSTAALDAYQTALALADQEGAIEEVAALHGHLEEEFRYLGEQRRGFKHLYQALLAARRVDNVRRLDPILAQMAAVASAAGHDAVARSFYDEIVQRELEEGHGALSGDEAAAAAHASLESAAASFKLGDRERLKREIGAARLYLTWVGDADLRRRDEADLQMVESGARSLGQPREAAKAVTEISRSIAFYRGQGHVFFLGSLYRARSAAELARGDEVRAEADLRSGIAELERQRGRVADEELRVLFFDQARGLFEDLIGLLARQHRPGDAFEAAERARGRALLDRLGPLGSRAGQLVLARELGAPLDLQTLQQALPRGVAIVEYQFLQDRLLTWVVTREEFSEIEQVFDIRLLEEETQRYSSLLADHAADDSSRPLAMDLYDRLIRPILPRLKPGFRLLLVPDRGLHGLPFAALLDRGTGRYLVADRVLTVAPCAAAYLRALDLLEESEKHRPALLLAVGNPSFDRRLEGFLPDLPEAGQEAAALAALFDGSRLLQGEQATKKRFLEAAGQYDIVYFAGHAILSPEAPLLSHLLLTPQVPGDSGFLYAHELYGQRFAHTRLAVLAACGTASGPPSGEGLLGIARAFLAAGVPTVIATLWSVGDHETRLLSRALGDRLHAGADPAFALHEAQLQLLANRDAAVRSPSVWAAFQIFGAMNPPNPPTDRLEQ
jgi:CHAT domain-containing protein